MVNVLDNAAKYAPKESDIQITARKIGGDVVIDVAGLDSADDAAAFLASEEQELAFRIDGELSFPGLGEVQWREFLQDYRREKELTPLYPPTD